MKMTAVSVKENCLPVGNTGNVLKASCLITVFPFLIVGNWVCNLIFNQHYKKITVHLKNVLRKPVAESNTTWCSNSTFHQVTSTHSLHLQFPPGGTSTYLFGEMRNTKTSRHLFIPEAQSTLQIVFVHHIWEEKNIVNLILLMRKHRLSYLLMSKNIKNGNRSGYSSIKQLWNKSLNP